MAKDKRKKKSAKGALPGKVTKRLRNISQNPLVADIVAATLVAAASALKDSRKARRLAAEAGDELEKLSKRGAEQGNALWKLALDVGRKSAEALIGEDPGKAKKAKASKAKSSSAAKPKKTKAKSAAKSAARSSPKSSSPKGAKRPSRPKSGTRK